MSDTTESKLFLFYWKIRWALRRLRRRLKPSILFRDLFWEYESCVDCGSCYREMYWLKNDVWMHIVKSETPCLCVCCLHNRARNGGIVLSVSDFERYEIFLPEELEEKPMSEKEKLLSGDLLTVIIRDDGPMIFVGGSPSYRRVTLRLTREQQKKLRLYYVGHSGGNEYYETVDRCFIEKLEDTFCECHKEATDE